MQKITPFLWFDHQAEEAIHLYMSIFKDSKILELSRYGEGAPMPAGTLMSATFVLNGQELMAMNAGPHFKFNEAISLFVRCENQAEVDEYWNKLTADGGEESMCGWLKDKYGLSWQIIPKQLGEMLGASDPAKAGRAMQAMLQMHKIEIAALQAAFDGK